MSSKLGSIVATGNRGHRKPGDGMIVCADGFTVSVIAGGGTYCTPRPALCTCAYNLDRESILIPGIPGEVPHDYPGPFTAVEVGFPSTRPEPWDQWRLYAEEPDNPKSTVYSYVPVDLVGALIASHGGEESR